MAVSYFKLFLWILVIGLIIYFIEYLSNKWVQLFLVAAVGFFIFYIIIKWVAEAEGD